jgi:predicted kinase
MSKIIIMRGLPASGKSTKAKELVQKYGNTVRINKDLLRTMLHFDKFNFNNEDITCNVARTVAKTLLESGVGVIIDDTNLNPSTFQSWKDLGKDLGCKIEHHNMETNFEDCVRRDSRREKRVGRHVILKQALQFKELWKGRKAIICDLDGTLADIKHRLPLVKGENKDWGAFFSLIEQDKLNNNLLDKIKKIEMETGAKIIFVSARPETYRENTLKWFEKEVVYDRDRVNLIMREENDKRPDTEVKADIYEKYLKQLDILAVFDDRPSVIRMWREKGLNVIDCGGGIEF